MKFLQKTKGAFSEGSLEIQASGDGGNGDQLEITAQGAQFGLTNFEKTDNGFKLTIFGNWELKDFLIALENFKQRELEID